MEKKNVAMSVRARLLNIRNSEPGTEYMQVLLRYIQERMLYRLSMIQRIFRRNVFITSDSTAFRIIVLSRLADTTSYASVAL